MNSSERKARLAELRKRLKVGRAEDTTSANVGAFAVPIGPVLRRKFPWVEVPEEEDDK